MRPTFDRRARAVAVPIVGVLAVACARGPAPTPAGSAAAAPPPASAGAGPTAPDTGWRPLFDGKTTAGWRGYRQQAMPNGWQVVDGALTNTGGGGDIITDEQYANFELSLEWKIAPGGNSGVFYRATQEGESIHHSAPEMQVLDDAGHPDGTSRLTAAGAVFALYAAPAGIVRPAGEWNQARIVVDGARVEHWLNGQKVVQYTLWSPDWEQRVKRSKFAEWPFHGRAKSGYIGLQDHGDTVAYRAIRIRVLP